MGELYAAIDGYQHERASEENWHRMIFTIMFNKDLRRHQQKSAKSLWPIPYLDRDSNLDNFWKRISTRKGKIRFIQSYGINGLFDLMTDQEIDTIKDAIMQDLVFVDSRERGVEKLKPLMKDKHLTLPEKWQPGPA